MSTKISLCSDPQGFLGALPMYSPDVGVCGSISPVCLCVSLRTTTSLSECTRSQITDLIPHATLLFGHVAALLG